MKSEYGEDNIVAINDILSVSYDRNARKSILETQDNVYYSRKNLSEVEDILSNYENFVRIERGMIINMKKVVRINYENGFLGFEGDKKIYYSRLKLKEIRELVKEKMGLGQI